MRPSSDTVLNLHPVVVFSLGMNDQCFSDFDAFESPILGVRTDNCYELLLLIPKAGKPSASISPGLHKLELKPADYREGDTCKPVEIDGGGLGTAAGVPFTETLDLLTDRSWSQPARRTLRLSTSKF